MNKWKLIGRMREKGYSISSFASAIEMPLSTLRYKLNHATFGTDDIKKVMKVLDITDPVPYFFS